MGAAGFELAKIVRVDKDGIKKPYNMVRCVCGALNKVYESTWANRGKTQCRRCKHWIDYGSLWVHPSGEYLERGMTTTMRPKVLRGGRVTMMEVEFCTCGEERGPEGGVCACGCAIPNEYERRARNK